MSLLEKQDLGTIFLWLEILFIPNAHFIFCKPIFSDNSIFFILVELHKVEYIIAWMFLTLTMLMLMLLKISAVILMMNKMMNESLKLLYIPIVFLLSELVMIPMIHLSVRGGSPTLSTYPDSRSDTNNKPMDYFTYIFTV